MITISGSKYMTRLEYEELLERELPDGWHPGRTDESTYMGRMFGHETAEDAYDRLRFEAQIITDLTVAGWTQSEIARLLECSQPKINWTLKSVAIKLADSQFYRVLDGRRHYREELGR